MESLDIFSSFGDAFENILDMLSTHSTVFLLVSAAVAFFFALYGFKLFKIFVGFVLGCIGLGLGSVIGTFVALMTAYQDAGMENLMKWLPLIFALVFGIWFALLGYKHPFGLIKFAVGCLTYLSSCLFFVAKFENIEETWFLSCILLPIIVTLIVCWIVGLILTAFVIIATSFGGAYVGVSSLMTLLSISTGIITIILSVVIGVVCLIFQAKNTGGKKTKLKEFLFPKKKA